MGTPLTTTVNILDKDYRVSCPEAEQDNLMKAARHLDRCMRDIRGRGKVIGIERIAIMAALNIAHEMLLSGHQCSAEQRETQQHINVLLKRLDRALQEAHPTT